MKEISLEDKYTTEDGRIFLNGTQALVRLPLMQRIRDLKRGHNTAGYISGYRGSPLGQVDQQLWAASKHLKNHHVVFNPGVNEDLAATSVWGSQQMGFHGKPKYDGVFSIWYGKGPGVDRTGDAFRHGNLAGTHPLGGVLALMGDDHTGESSTTLHQSEYAMVDAMMPILNPAGVQELLDYGLIGWELSRFSGCWVGLKCMKDTIDASATVEVSPSRVKIKIPRDFNMPRTGLNIRWPDEPKDQEERLHRYKIEAVRAFAKANQLDRTVIETSSPQIGVVTCGKSYMDVRQALQYLGLDETEADRLGLRVYKVAMTWPMEPEGIVNFAKDLKKVLVVEEKRGLMEGQIKEILYNQPNAPIIIGKKDEMGRELFPSISALDPNSIAIILGRAILEMVNDEHLAHRVNKYELISNQPKIKPAMERTPYFCSGCPHNTGTKLPDGSIALSGIGCHFMVQWTDPNTSGYTQMGAEGAGWMGEAPFIERPHAFQNIGDGTYYHSGLLAVRASVASGVNVTYKILFNDAVAMTGGQQVDGPLTVPKITHQLTGESVKKIVVVTDEPNKYGSNPGFAPSVEIYHRDEYTRVQKEIRKIPGTTAIIYDQTCGSEKRRRRKRNLYPDPPKRAFINDLVCEGCGDCSVKSNCVSVTPLETKYGRKRKIDQSACNKDYSCVNGFCPSFVTVHGGGLKKQTVKKPDIPVESLFPVISEPGQPDLKNAYGILVTGIGGTGVVTIGAIIGMAAHLEGKSFGGLDMAGLAQKGGAVWSHLQIASSDDDIKTVRLGNASAKVLIGGDLVVSGSEKTLGILAEGTQAVVNLHQQMTREFNKDANFRFPHQELQRDISKRVGKGNVNFIEATKLATSLHGNSIATNMFLLGFAFQKGLIPLASKSLNRAIELNGVAVKMNQMAFIWGRRAANDLNLVNRLVNGDSEQKQTFDDTSYNTVDGLIADRFNFLVAYQNENYAQRYKNLVEKTMTREKEKVGELNLTKAVARYYFKLMAYKDEYEVARLHSDKAFELKVKAQFEGNYRLRYHLAPPLFSKKDPETGHLIKREFGSWVGVLFKILARLKFLRGTKFDLFGYTQERRMERGLIEQYAKSTEELLDGLTKNNYDLAVSIASIPEDIRGYGHVKELSIKNAQDKERILLRSFKNNNKFEKKAA